MKTVNKLIMMANQIAANLAHESDPALATAEHIRLFWAPSMKQTIVEHGKDGLSQIAAAAIAALAAQQGSHTQS